MTRLAILPALLLLGASDPFFRDATNDASSWPAKGSESVIASSRSILAPHGRAIELSYDFDRVSGYAFIRHQAKIVLPHNFAIRFRMRASGGRNDVQFKLTDGDNVWWKVWRNLRPSPGWQDVVVPAGDLAFAWGPSSDRRLLRADGIELVVARNRDGGSGTIAISDLRILPLAGEPAGAAPPQDDRTNAQLEAIGKSAPRGNYPRSLINEQPYWTLAGSDGHGIAALIDEDGGIEFEKGGYSIAPAVIEDGRMFDWANVAPNQTLAEGRLPIPTVQWSAPDFRLETTLLADYAGRAAYASYTLTNLAKTKRVFELRLKLRPWQVNPPAQFLSQKGGASRIARIAQSGSTLTIIQPQEDGDPPLKRRLSLTDGARLDPVAQPPSAGPDMAGTDVVYRVPLGPGANRRVVLTAPAGPRFPAFDASLSQTLAHWRSVSPVEILVPPSKQTFADTLATSYAHVLMSREGPRLQPGTRSYDRAWIRDGAMMSEALLRMGRADVARAFADWYGTHQFRSGQVPCCVDFRGADPVPENDSQGEYIFLVSELYRYTHDRASLQREWPHVLAAAHFMDKLRASERGARGRDASDALHFGLMPPSISHEGYSAKPQYSLWDDFWALRGYKDAAALAAVLGRPEAQQLAASRDQFSADVHSAILAARDHWRSPFIPGATSLGDFDPTSTTIALDPGGDQALLDARMLQSTFGRYWTEFEERSSGKRPWKDYTPYEVRTIGAFVRLGWRDRIDDLLSFFMAGRRPAGWNQWAEVVGRDPREVRFIGDMPHAWVASDFIRSALDMFAWDRRDDQALVLGAGLSQSWLIGRGSSIHGLQTPYGSLDFSISGNSAKLIATIGGTARPPGGFVIGWPFDGDPPAVRINGRPAIWPKAGLHILATGAPVGIETTGLRSEFSEHLK